MSTVVALNIHFEALTCWMCSVSFAVPYTLKRKREEDGKSFYCPNGCHLSFGDSEVSKLQKKLEDKDRQLEAKDKEIVRKQKRVEWAKKETDNERRSHSATRGHLTRQKKRAKAGTCPCCKRTFKQLSQHMAKKHPDFDPES